MRPELFILMCVTVVFGLVCAIAPRYLFRVASSTPFLAKTADAHPSGAKIRLLRLLGITMAVLAPVFALLSRRG
jgi:uncharacterized membrane protein (UPF0182 family)